MTPQGQLKAATRRSLKRRLVRLAPVVVVVFLLAVVAVKAVTDARAATLRAATEAEQGRGELFLGLQTVKADVNQAGLAARHFMLASDHFGRARTILTQSKMLRLASHLPMVDRQMHAAIALTDMGARFSHDAQLVADAISPVADSQIAAQSDPGARIAVILNRLEPELDPIGVDLRAIASDRAGIALPGLLPQLATAVKEFDAKVNAAQLVDKFAVLRADESAIRHLLGLGAARSYLVLQQDPAELRGTGGFIGSVGFLSFHDGKMAPFVPEDINKVDLDSKGSFVLGGTGSPSHVDPPYPLEHVFHLPSWELRDANWSPDFPTAAQQAEFLLNREVGRQVDGVIAIDPYFIQRLLSITGPIRIQQTGDVVDEHNFFDITLRHVEVSLSPGRKNFLSYVAKPILEHVVTLPTSKWPAVLQALQQSCYGRSLQAYFNDEQLEALASRYACDGRLQRTAGDGLMIVEANVGGNKDDFWMRRRYDLKVQMRSDGSARHILHLHYYGLSAHDVLLTKYWGYTGWLRIYLPPGASLVSVNGTRLSPNSELGRLVLSGWFYVQFDHTGDVQVEYDLPPAVMRATGNQVQVLWQKQAGRVADPITVEFLAAPGWQLVSARLDAARATDGPIASDLAVDRHFTFDLHPAS